MTRRELDAAGITDPRLRASYARCRALNARHGRTYFLATRLLEPWRRPAVHALYGFARYADDIVDEPGAEREPDRIAARLTAVAGALDAGLRSGRSGHPVLAAVVDTAGRYGIDAALFAAFLRSMRMDLTVTDYPTRDALREYMYGSAEVIGLQMLPVLGTVGDPAEAAPHAAALGQAFQLTNFLRDVAEDLDRGRVYLPADELAAHGVDRDVLGWCRRTGRVDARTRRALADQVARTRAVYRRARPGIALLQPASRPCIATAYALYAGILDGIEARDHNVFGGRVTVGRGRRTALAGAAFTRVLWARARAAANGGAASGDVRRAGGGRAGERRSGEGLAGERHAGERHTGEGPVGDRRARNAPGPSASVPGGPTRAGNETSVPDKTVAPAPGRRTAPGSGGRAAPGSAGRAAPGSGGRAAPGSGGRTAPGSGGRAGPPGLRAGPASGGRGDAGPGGSIGPDGNTPHPGRGHGASGKD